jgi:glycerophosphoryl diester phosphodiesterase
MKNNLDTDFFTPSLPRVIAHRGASGDYPENTLPAFRAAADAGTSYIELDVHLSRDGEVVVTHDDNPRRVACHDGLIAEMTMAELETMDAGFNFSADGVGFPFRGKGIRIPRLVEVLKTWPEQRFVIEFKPRDPAIADATLEAVQRTAMGRRVFFASEHLAPIARIRVLAPQTPTNMPAPEILAFIQSLAPEAPPYAGAGDALQIPAEHYGWKLATAETVAAAHRHGLEIHVFTVNQQAEMAQMLSLGIDGLITDYPARLLRLIAMR